LDFAFVLEFLAATSLLEPAEVCRTELKPFLTILGTRMRARMGKPQKPKTATFIGKADGFRPDSSSLAHCTT